MMTGMLHRDGAMLVIGPLNVLCDRWGVWHSKHVLLQPFLDKYKSPPGYFCLTWGCRAHLCPRKTIRLPPSIICRFKKTFWEEEGQKKKRMCFSGWSKRAASNWQSCGKVERERERLGNKSDQSTFTFFTSSPPHTHFQTLFICCASFFFGAGKHHQHIY